MKWDVAYQGSRRSQYEAIGILVGNTLSATWAGSGNAGVIAYQIGNDGHLRGKWTVFGNSTTRTEVLLTSKPRPAAPVTAAEEPTPAPKPTTMLVHRTPRAKLRSTQKAS